MIVRSYVDIETFEPVYTEPGSPMVDQFERVDDPNGMWHLEKTGERNIQDLINSACPPSVSDAIRRAQLGDMSLLTAFSGEPQYGDVSRLQNLGVDDLFDISQRANAEAEKYNQFMAAQAAAADQKEGASGEAE